MARIRSIRPEFWSDRKVGSVSRDARLLFVALWNFADDEGFGRALPKELAGFAFPYDDDVESASIRRWLDELSMKTLLILYEVSGEPYYQIPTFSKHQKIDRPTKSRLPKPTDEGAILRNPHDWPISAVPRRILDESSMNLIEPSLLVNRNQELGGRNQDVGSSNSFSSSELASSPRPSRVTKPPKEYPPEALELAELLAGLIEGNGAKRPNVTATWHDALEKMHRIDGRPWSEIEAVLRWSQQNDFWRSNILSAPKLREKFDTLKLRMGERRRAIASSSKPSPVQEQAGAVENWLRQEGELG